MGTDALAAPRWQRTGKIDIILKKLAREVILAECQRRGTSASPTINALITEWHLLSRIRRAEDFRRDLRQALDAIRSASRATAGPGRDAALLQIHRAIEVISSLVTAL